jgi:glycerol-3-phosphate dehydrogenase (NAD+)
MITSCTSGRNYSLARVFATRENSTFPALEAELLGGQKLQGVSTAAQVHAFLAAKGDLGKFPLFEAVHEIANLGGNLSGLMEAVAADDGYGSFSAEA